jgi:hypothetical protein
MMIGINFIMNAHFYPRLLPYQWGNQTAQFIDQNGIDKNKVMAYQLPNSYAFHFYGHIFPINMDSAAFEKASLNIEFVVTEAHLNKESHTKTISQCALDYVKKAERFHVTLLTLPFLNPATRSQETNSYGILQLTP